MAQRRIVFDANELLELLKHYTAQLGDSEPENVIPLHAELREFGFNRFLQRYVQMLVRGPWVADEKYVGGGMDPLHLRYHGKRVMTWGERGADPVWHDEDKTRG